MLGRVLIKGKKLLINNSSVISLLNIRLIHLIVIISISV